MAASHGAASTGITALALLQQRQQEDWIRAWDEQGNLRPELNARSITIAAQQLQDWLAQQDWLEWDGIPPSHPHGSQTSPPAPETTSETVHSYNPKQQSILEVSDPQPDRSDHLISRPIVLLAVSDPAHFLIWFSAASSLGYSLFLGNPQWSRDHWQQVQEGLIPHLIITDPKGAISSYFPWKSRAVDNSCYLWEKQEFPQVFTGCGKRIDPSDHGHLGHLRPIFEYPQAVESLWIGVPTGGSSGQLRFALHRWNTLTASVSGLQQSQFTDESGVINSCCTLPLFHVSGLMQFLRSLLSGGQLWLLPWAVVKRKFNGSSASYLSHPVEANSSDFPFSLDLAPFFLSLVPTQLQRLLQDPNGIAWLVRFNTVFLGGAPAWASLLEQAQKASIRLAPTYGMTETASQVITLHPDDFLKGQKGCGKLLPHAQVEWLSEARKTDPNCSEIEPFETETPCIGILKIRAHSLALGYYAIQPLKNQATTHYQGKLERWPGLDGLGDSARGLVTDDLGYCDSDGYIHIVGRNSDKIISGGENIFPAAVEAAILATKLVQDAVVLGLPDGEWGERVVAVVAIAPDVEAKPKSAMQALWPPLQSQLAGAIAPALSPAQRPKQWLCIDAIPRNAQGKIQRQALRAWALQQSAPSSIP